MGCWRGGQQGWAAGGGGGQQGWAAGGGGGQQGWAAGGGGGSKVGLLEGGGGGQQGWAAQNNTPIISTTLTLHALGTIISSPLLDTSDV